MPPSAEVSRRSEALEVGAARLGLARPADAAGLDPGGRRDPHGPRDRLAARPAASDRGVDRSRGRMAQPTRHEPARHEPGRGRRAQAELCVFELADIVERVLEAVAWRGRQPRSDRTVDVRGPDLPPILVDEVFIGQVLANTARQRAKYAGPDGARRDHRLRDGRGRRPDHGRGRWPGRAPMTRCRACSRSSTACRARARAHGAGPGSACPSSRASSSRWVDR